MQVNVKKLGAKGDGQELDTSFFQEAIDQAAKIGGGTVFVPAGKYLISNIFLRDNVTIELSNGSELLASPDLSNYDKRSVGHNKDRQPYSMIIAENVSNIEICGSGKINGQGPKFWLDDPVANPIGILWYREKQERVSPLIEIINCKNIKVKDITIYDSPGWTLHLHDCNNVNISGIIIDNHLLGPNTDGIDINGCIDVIISDCHISCGDDSIVIKTTPDSRPSKRITVTNCLLRSNCAAFKLGATESFYDIEDVTFSNSVIYESNRGVALYALEGGNYDSIVISNIVCDTFSKHIPVAKPIHIDARRRSDDSKLSKIKNVQISNFIAKTEGRVLITAEPDSYIENLIIRDLHIIYPKQIEDPTSYRDMLTAQFSNRTKDARIAKAAIVLRGVKNSSIDNYKVSLPEDYNGDFREINGKDVRNVEVKRNGLKIDEKNQYLMDQKELFII